MLRRITPLVREGVSAAAIMTAGDMLAQFGIEKKSLTEYDVKRTATFACLGFAFVGPTLRLWYSSLDKLIVKEQPAFKRAVKKMCLDQACFAPVFTVAFTGILGTVNGESKLQIEQRLRSDYVDIMKTNYMLWPAAQLINFGIVPLQYQVVFAQLVAVIWNSYLSTTLNKKLKEMPKTL